MDLAAYRTTRASLVTTLLHARRNNMSHRALQLALTSIRSVRAGRDPAAVRAHQQELCDRYLPLCERRPDATLEEALAEIGRREDADERRGVLVFRLCKDVAHWHGYGITTAEGLWSYLDGCAAAG